MPSPNPQGPVSVVPLGNVEKSRVKATLIDFSQTPLAEQYDSYFALVLDHLLSPAECSALQASAGNDWQVRSSGESYRDCQQIKTFSPEWSAVLFERITVHLPAEIKTLRKGSTIAENIVGNSLLKARMGAKKSEWRLQGTNEKLSFLRYGPGHFFKPHCDALYARDGKDEKSFLTCQIYLNDAPEGVDENTSGGGETRFWASQLGKRQREHRIPNDDDEDEGDDGRAQYGDETPFLDVKPKTGRALIFQQRMLWHSGQEVKLGEKYTVRMDLMYERHFEKY